MYEMAYSFPNVLKIRKQTITLNVAECELVAGRVGVARTCSGTRQEQLERWTIGQRVPVGGADLNDRSSGRKILIEDGPIVFSELWIIVIHVDQVNNQRTCTCPCRLTCPTVYSMTLASSVSNGEVANSGAVRWVQTIPPQFLQDFVPQTFYRGLARGPTGRLLSPQPLTNPFPHPGSAPVVY